MTSLETDTTPGDHLDMMVAEGGTFHLLRTPRLPVSVNGAGDAIAGLFLYHRLRTGSAVAALEAAGSSVHGLLRRTAEAGAREIQLVAAQDEFVAPTQVFRTRSTPLAANAGAIFAALDAEAPGPRSIVRPIAAYPARFGCNFSPGPPVVEFG